MRDDRRYLDYLDNQNGEKRGQKTKDLLVRETALSTPKSLLFNRDPFSQAGRRGFESHLPLHRINNLHGSQPSRKPSFQGNEVGVFSQRIDGKPLQRMNASVAGWTSITGLDEGASRPPDSSGYRDSQLGSRQGQFIADR